MGTIGHVLLLAILVVIALFSLGNEIFSDDAFCRWYLGKEPKPSGVNVFIRWLGYIGLGILFEIAFGFGWRIYLPLFVLLFSVMLVFAIRKRRLSRGTEAYKNTARVG
jgi:hypothetical protein